MKPPVKILLFVAFVFTTFSSGAVRYHCAEDSLKVADFLEAASKGGDFGGRVVEAARFLENIPVGTTIDNDSIGTLAVSFHSLDQIGFLDMILGAARATMKTNPGIRDFEIELEKVGRRKGHDDGFASQFLYGSDWIVDNVYRGNVKDMTEYVEHGNFKTKTLDRVSRNPEKYPAMKDSAVNEKIKLMEYGYRSHKIPHLKKQSAGNKAIHENMYDGDIIMMLPTDNDYDIYEIGVVQMKDGVPYLIHLSNTAGKVIKDDYPLMRLFKLDGQYFYGFRWLRPLE